MTRTGLSQQPLVSEHRILRVFHISTAENTSASELFSVLYYRLRAESCRYPLMPFLDMSRLACTGRVPLGRVTVLPEQARLIDVQGIRQSHEDSSGHNKLSVGQGAVVNRKPCDAKHASTRMREKEGGAQLERRKRDFKGPVAECSVRVSSCLAQTPQSLCETSSLASGGHDRARSVLCNARPRRHSRGQECRNLHRAIPQYGMPSHNMLVARWSP